MIDSEGRYIREEKKRKIQRRYRPQIDPDKVIHIPGKNIKEDFYDENVPKRVAVYVRVSTDNIRQTTSFELQKNYYEEYVLRHNNWTLVHIYADEGISGTTLKHRDGLLEMISDCKAGKIDLIITKTVSRLMRNVEILLSIVRELSSLNPPVGIFFESEYLMSLNDENEMALTFQATMAQEESHIRSRSMEASLRMRLDHGIPLTPKLYGYMHDEDGELIINPDEAPTVKLMYYMYLYGYSTQQIADTLIALERRCYRGKIGWTSSGVLSILRNERHCGDVLTRKTRTLDYKTHKVVPNHGYVPQTHYLDHHEAIVSRDDFNAVQRMLDNAKYGNKSILPELRVIDSGILKGFVVVNPRWSGFKELDYLNACRSAYPELANCENQPQAASDESTVQVNAGDFDFRGFEIARSELFETKHQPSVTFTNSSIKFGAECANKFGKRNFVELLVNPVEGKFAVRPTTPLNRSGVYISKMKDGKLAPYTISGAAFLGTIFSLFGWNQERKYRIIGYLAEYEGEQAYIFDTSNSEAFFKAYMVSKGEDPGSGSASQPLFSVGKHVKAIPQDWVLNFGKSYYEMDQSYSALEKMTEQDWKLRIDGRLYEPGVKLNVTSYEKLRGYISDQLGGVMPGEVNNGRMENA